MSALDELLDSFETDEEDKEAWFYYGSVDPKDAAAELAAQRRELEELRKAGEAMAERLWMLRAFRDEAEMRNDSCVAVETEYIFTQEDDEALETWENLFSLPAPDLTREEVERGG